MFKGVLKSFYLLKSLEHTPTHNLHELMRTPAKTNSGLLEINCTDHKLATGEWADRRKGAVVRSSQRR